jgi:hypothetical protein
MVIKEKAIGSPESIRSMKQPKMIKRTSHHSKSITSLFFYLFALTDVIAVDSWGSPIFQINKGPSQKLDKKKQAPDGDDDENGEIRGLNGCGLIGAAL